MNDRHGHLAFAQVAGDRLAQHAFGSGEIEHVIHNLKCHAKITPVAGNLILLLGSCSAENCAHAHANGEQARRLAVDEIEVLIERDQFAKLFHL